MHNQKKADLDAFLSNHLSSVPNDSIQRHTSLLVVELKKDEEANTKMIVHAMDAAQVTSY